MKFTRKEYNFAAVIYDVYIGHVQVTAGVHFNELTDIEQESWIMVVREKIKEQKNEN